MQCRPFSDEAKGRARVDGTDQHLAVEVELRLEPLVLCVKVWWFVIVVKHPDDDPEEDRYRRHGSILPTSAVSRLGIGSVGITPALTGRGERRRANGPVEREVRQPLSGVPATPQRLRPYLRGGPDLVDR